MLEVKDLVDFCVYIFFSILGLQISFTVQLLNFLRAKKLRKGCFRLLGASRSTIWLESCLQDHIDSIFSEITLILCM